MSSTCVRDVSWARTVLSSRQNDGQKAAARLPYNSKMYFLAITSSGLLRLKEDTAQK